MKSECSAAGNKEPEGMACFAYYVCGAGRKRLDQYFSGYIELDPYKDKEMVRYRYTRSDTGIVLELHG